MYPKGHFVSAMLDYDGTITAERGIKTIEPRLEELLLKLTHNHTFSICSGRRFPFLKPVIDSLCSRTDNPDLVRQNWYLVCENGAAGYYYDLEKGDYVEHYHIPWPYGDEHKDQLYQKLTTDFADQIESHENNRSVLILRPHKHEEMTDAEITQKSKELLELVLPTVTAADPGNHLYAFNSAIAVIIMNTSADKDTGIRYFSEFLAAHRDLNSGPAAKKILTIGDRPAPGGNDEAFLSGKYGTPFTVGDPYPENTKLQLVADEKGTPLKAAAGTKYLLEQLF